MSADYDVFDLLEAWYLGHFDKERDGFVIFSKREATRRLVALSKGCKNWGCVNPDGSFHWCDHDRTEAVPA